MRQFLICYFSVVLVLIIDSVASRARSRPNPSFKFARLRADRNLNMNDWRHFSGGRGRRFSPNNFHETFDDGPHLRTAGEEHHVPDRILARWSRLDPDVSALGGHRVKAGHSIRKHSKILHRKPQNEDSDFTAQELMRAAQFQDFQVGMGPW